jgi:histidine phosphotransferase ChpT
MTQAVDLRVLELLAARLCHDLIGPVAAIGNGVELLADEEPQFVKEAVGLIADTAKKASRRLQFLRFALGHGGGELTGPAPHLLVGEYFADSGIECDYRAEVQGLASAQQKLACAMVAVAAEGLPRGGRLVVRGGALGPEIDASGAGNGLSAELRAALTLAAPSAELTARTVTGYFAGLLALALGWRLVVSDQPGGFRLAAAA